VVTTRSSAKQTGCHAPKQSHSGSIDSDNNIMQFPDTPLVLEATRWSKGPVTGLLQVGAWMDASGLRKNSIAREKRLAIETAFPRAGFDAEFRVRFRTALGSPRACLRLLFPPT
jgi:hypothetical protein